MRLVTFSGAPGRHFISASVPSPLYTGSYRLGTYTPWIFAASSRKSRLLQSSSRAFWKRRSTSTSTSSPSPNTMRSMNGAIGSGLQQLVPPANTSGTSSCLSSLRTGSPAMSSMSSTVQ